MAQSSSELLPPVRDSCLLKAYLEAVEMKEPVGAIPLLLRNV